MNSTKYLADLALEAGRHFQCSETGFVHLNNMIPVFENVLFAYTLLRTRLVPNVQEAKDLLKKVLYFQNYIVEENKGHFPNHLHEYPFCKDPALGLKLLAPFYWMLKQFSSVLGESLTVQLMQSAETILECCLQIHKNQPFPFFLEFRLAGALVAFGQLRSNHEWIEKSQSLFQTLISNQLYEQYSTKQLAHILIGLQMCYHDLSNSPFKPLWDRIGQFWHAGLASYRGPCLIETQEGEEPATNLFDLFGCYFSGKFSSRTYTPHAFHLHGILIQPSNDQLIQSDHFHYSNENWSVFGDKDWACTLLKKENSKHRNHTCFRYLWGSLEKLHSFVCQGGNADNIQFLYDNGQIQLFFDLLEIPTTEEGKTKKEIEFFIDIHPELQIKIEGSSSNTFEMGQSVEFLLGNRRCALSAEIVEGSGDFMGHLMRGNRPSQTKHKGDHRFMAYDWTFFLRSIRRKGQCKIKITLSFI